MNLIEWFNENENNLQAVYDAKNGRRYIYKRNSKLSKFAKNLKVEQVVDVEGGFGAWLY